MVQISQEVKEQIRERIITDDDEALRLLELYDTVDQMCLRMENDLKDYEGYTPRMNGELRELLREIHPMLRLRNDLLKELRYISQQDRRGYEEDNEDDQRGRSRRITPKANTGGARKPSTNRQHRNRASKRHDGVSNES